MKSPPARSAGVFVPEPQGAATPTTFTHGYALLVGVDENHVNGYALPDVAKDIHALADVLVHPQCCTYPVDNVKADLEPVWEKLVFGLPKTARRVQRMMGSLYTTGFAAFG